MKGTRTLFFAGLLALSPDLIDIATKIMNITHMDNEIQDIVVRCFSLTFAMLRVYTDTPIGVNQKPNIRGVVTSDAAN